MKPSPGSFSLTSGEGSSSPSFAGSVAPASHGIVAEDHRPDPSLHLPVRWSGALSERFTAQARRRPEATAIVTPQAIWSYADLDGQAGRLANALRARGLGRDSIIAVHARRGPAVAWAVLGTLKAHAAYVLLDPDVPLAWRQQQLTLAQPCACIIVRAPDESDGLVLPPGCVRFEVALDPLRPDGDLFADEPPAPALPPVLPDDVAYVAFTSGTSGTPRGIVGTQRPLSHFLNWQVETLGLDEADRFILTAGIGTDLFIRELFTPWWCGAALFIPAHEVLADAEHVALAMRDHGITVAHFTPSTARLLSLVATTPWTALRHLSLAGEPLHGADMEMLRRQAPNACYWNFYGTTETPQVMGCHAIHDDHARDGIVPVGMGIDAVQLLILTRDQRLAAIGESGEIYVRTPYLARGYLNDSPRTYQHFVINPWTGDPQDRMFRTGDVGLYLSDGAVAIKGRRDDQVKIRGLRVMPTGIEAVLAGHPDIQGAAVIALPEPNGEARLVGYFVVRPDARLDATTVRQYLRERLPQNMVPAIIVPLARLPLTARGKVDRAALPTPDIGAGDPGERSKTGLEQSLAALWQELLGLSSIGMEENFFELGGHSLIATRISSRIQRMGIPVKLRDVFDHPTIASLAARLAELGVSGGQADTGESGPPRPPQDFAQSAPSSGLEATPASEADIKAVKARYDCPSQPSPWFGRRTCHLVIVINDRFHAEGFERLAAFVREWDPRITVSLVRDEPQAVLPDIPGPTLVMSPAMLRQAHLRRGKVLCGFPHGKDEEYNLLQKAGFPVPRWALLAENVTPDLSAFSPYVVRKPNYGGRGAGVRLVRKDKLHWKPLTSPLGGTSATTIVQEFIWTGPRSVNYRVSCLCGEVVYCLRHEAHRDRPILENLAAIPAVNGKEGFSIVASSRDSVSRFCHEEDVIALGEAASRAFADIPLLGFDIVREIPSGQLYLMEANAIGYVWYFDQRQYSDYGFPLEAQFDGLRKAGYVLAERTQQLAL